MAGPPLETGPFSELRRTGQTESLTLRPYVARGSTGKQKEAVVQNGGTVVRNGGKERLDTRATLSTLDLRPRDHDIRHPSDEAAGRYYQATLEHD